MISFPTEKAGWASRSAMFPAKALPHPLGTLAIGTVRNLSPSTPANR